MSEISVLDDYTLKTHQDRADVELRGLNDFVGERVPIKKSVPLWPIFAEYRKLTRTRVTLEVFVEALRESGWVIGRSGGRMDRAKIGYPEIRTLAQRSQRYALGAAPEISRVATDFFAGLLNPGQHMPIQQAYDLFRAQYQCPEVSNTHITRSVRSAEFDVRVRAINGRSTRCLERRP